MYAFVMAYAAVWSFTGRDTVMSHFACRRDFGAPPKQATHYHLRGRSFGQLYPFPVQSFGIRGSLC